MIDSNVVIGYLDKQLPDGAMQAMNSIIDEVPHISIITKIEVLRFNTSESNYSILKDFIAESIVLGLNDDVVELTISICKSSKIKLPDAIIAATAIVYNFGLLTRNVADFRNIAELEFINPWDAKFNIH